MSGESKDRGTGTRPGIEVAFVDAPPVIASGDTLFLSTWRSFGAPLSSDPVTAGEQARYLGNLAIEALMGDEVAARLLYGHFAGVHSGNNGAEKSQREKDEEFRTWMMRLAVEENLRRLQELIETKRAERGLLLAEIGDDERQLALLDRHKQGFERADNYFKLHGKYEFNENGELADADAEDMLKAWEKRTGKKLDRKDAKDVHDAFRDQLQFEAREALRIQRALEIKRERLGKLDEQIGELETAEKKAKAALENGADPAKINTDLQRELIEKGHGTPEQKEKLAKEQGITLSMGQRLEQENDDEFGKPSITPAFNQTASATQPKAPEIVGENAIAGTAPVKLPEMNLNG